MVAALDRHPDCQLAQCCLQAIDEHGAVIPGWWKLTGAARFLGSDYLQPHLRRAPYDGVLHCVMHTIYHSITQLLIRRTTFTRTGPFPTGYGPGGDFSWGLKAGLTCDVVHVPKFMATWRIHGAQASGPYRENATERALMVRMVDDALREQPPRRGETKLPTGPLRFAYIYDYFRHAFAEAPSHGKKLALLIRLIGTEPRAAAAALGRAVTGRRRNFDKPAYARRLLRRFGLENHFVPLPGPAGTPPSP
jgi:hypothetical protein